MGNSEDPLRYFHSDITSATSISIATVVLHEKWGQHGENKKRDILCLAFCNQEYNLLD